MSMGIVSPKQFDEELSKLNSSNVKNEIKKPEIIDMPTRGRSQGDVEVPDSLRQIIGDTAITDGRRDALDLAKNFGISSSSVSAYSQGATSTASYNERPNESKILQAKEKISRNARNKLSLALSKITGEKLDSAKVRDVAGVAKDMAAIIKYMEPETPKTPDGPIVNGPTFIMYSPQPKKEENFETIYARE